jgi:hypothetical protein
MVHTVDQLTERYLSTDPSRWAKLSSTIEFRRLQILLLREILLEVRRLGSGDRAHEGAESKALSRPAG